MGIFKFLLGSGEPSNGVEADAFGHGRRVKAKHAEAWANNRSGSRKSLAQRRKEHLAKQKRNR